MRRNFLNKKLGIMNLTSYLKKIIIYVNAMLIYVDKLENFFLILIYVNLCRNQRHTDRQTYQK